MSKLFNCFLAELGDIYDAEKQQASVLQKMAKASENAELKAAFLSQRATTEGHVRRIEELFEIFGKKAAARKSQTMQGIIAEIEDRIRENLSDAALICAAQKIEHYEIATYGCLLNWAQLMDNDDAASLIEETLDEENSADEQLTALAMRIVTLDAGETGKEQKETANAAKGGEWDDE